MKAQDNHTEQQDMTNQKATTMVTWDYGPDSGSDWKVTK